MTKLDDTIGSLATKIEALDLTEDEARILVAALSEPDDGDVEGFAYDLNPNQVSFKALLTKSLTEFTYNPLTADDLETREGKR